MAEGGGDGVMVGVRIRPFNGREKSLSAQLCLDVDGATTIIQQPPEVAEAEGGKGKDPKKFTFDASFWSHDGFEELPDGYLRAAPGSRYADQQLVFEMFGKKVLDNAWEGYHCCLFAYGQTGAGKSYSMVGYGANRGIVPVSCEEIFRRIASNPDPNLSFEVSASMVEIYNEQVQDLLVKMKDRPKKGLEIRESKQLGIYIDNVNKRPVDSYPAIERVVDEGTENRSVGSTLMNATSSRAHTVITIEFKQVSIHGGATGCKISLINLVDLAGSEKAGQTGASGDRLKEGCAINKSLSALGNVIEKLADKATGKAKAGAVIPYRDSKLTRLLQNALGGSSKTIMICALSPASSNYEETLSTLRYADRAKRIKNTAVINENPQDKLIRQLREENQKLKEMIGGMGSTTDASGIPEEEMLQKQAEIAQLEGALKEMQRSFSDRLKQAKEDAERGKKEKADLTLPHIANLNEDDLLTNKLQFAFKEGQTRIGRGGGEDADPDVTLSGLGIHKEHAVVKNEGGQCLLTALGTATATTFVNGANPPAEGIALKHGDRVVFGQCYFVFVMPAEGSAKQLLASPEVSYANARKELAGGQGEVSGMSPEELAENKRRSEELEKRAREAEEARQAAEKEAADLLRQREEEYRAKIENLQQDWDKQRELQTEQEAAAAEQAKSHAEELARLQREFEDRQKQQDEASQRRIQELEKKAQKAAAEEEDHRQHELNMRKLEEQLMFVMPLVKEANLIAVELNRPHRLETKMEVELSSERSRGTIHVTAKVLRDGVCMYEWSPETLENRVFLLRELLQRCEEEGMEAAQHLSDEDDPLWDPVEAERLIGVAQVLLEGLLLQVENELDARILSMEGHQCGSLRVEVWPLAKDGSLGIPDEEVVEDAEELLGTRMAILVRIPSASGLPEDLANDVRVEYDYFIDEKPQQVPRLSGHGCDPEFKYEHTFVQDPVTSRFLEYLRAKMLVFRVYGRDVAAEKKQAEADAAVQAAALAAAPAPRVETPPEPSPEPVMQLAEEPLPRQETPPLQDVGTGDVMAEQTASAPPSPEQHKSAEALSPSTASPPKAPSLAEVRRDQEKAAELMDTAPETSGKPKSKACSIL